MSANFEPVELPEEYNCPLCTGVMHEAFSLSPCNDKVCSDCARLVDTCPMCRAAIQSKSKDHQYTSVVEDAVRRQEHKCKKCGVRMAREATARHQCMVDLIRHYSDMFQSVPPSDVESLLLAHKARGLPVDDDTLTTMLLVEQEKRARGIITPAPAPPTPQARPRLTPAPTHTAERSRVTVLWDFQVCRQWSPSDVRSLYLALVERLVRDDAALPRNRVSATAFGHRDAMVDNVLKALQDMGVAVEVVSTVKPEDLNRAIERAASAVVKNGAQQTTEVVLISSKAEFTPLVRLLEDRDIKVMAVHGTDAGSEVARMFELQASLVVASSELHNVAPAAPSIVQPPPPSPSRERLCATGCKWALGLDLKAVCTVETAHGGALVRTSEVVRGTPKEGCRLSFRVRRDAGTSELQAYDVVVLEPGEVVGTIVSWGSVGANNRLFGFAKDGTAGGDLFMHSSAVEHGVPAPGAEAVFTVAPGRDGRRQARGVCVLGASDKQPTARRGQSPAVLPHGTRRDATHSISPLGAQVHVDPRAASVDHGEARAQKSAVCRTVRTERLSGVAHRWPIDKNAKKFTNIATPNGTVFVHSSSLLRGMPTDGCLVSFRVESSAGSMRAYDVVVLGTGEQIGTITSWGLKGTKGALFGFVEGGFFLHAGGIAQGTPAVGAEVVFTSTPGEDGRRAQARDVTVLTTRV